MGAEDVQYICSFIETLKDKILMKPNQNVMIPTSKYLAFL